MSASFDLFFIVNCFDHTIELLENNTPNNSDKQPGILFMMFQHRHTHTHTYPHTHACTHTRTRTHTHRERERERERERVGHR